MPPLSVSNYTSLTQPSKAEEVAGPQVKTAPINLRAHEWHVYFEEKDDPVAFLEQLLVICTAQQIHPDLLVPQLPTLLRGHASLWCRNNRQRWFSWQQFESDFRAFYFPLDYSDDLEAQISRRLQQQGEAVNSYFTDLPPICRL